MKEDGEPTQFTSSADFMSSFLTRHRPPQEALDHFASIPWLNAHLSDPAYKAIPTFSRHLKDTGEDYFFSRTINTPTTIPHMVSLRLQDFQTPEPTANVPDRQTENEPRHKVKTLVPEKPDALMLLRLGGPGVDGHPQTMHGGVTCAILDETMGLLVMLHDNNVRHTGNRNALYTANLNVSYRGPITTPSHVLVRTWLVKRQGRKWYSKGQIVDENGTVLAEADGLWVTVKEKL